MIHDLIGQAFVYLFILAIVLDHWVDREAGGRAVIYTVNGHDSVLYHLPRAI